MFLFVLYKSIKSVWLDRKAFFDGTHISAWRH